MILATQTRPWRLSRIAIVRALWLEDEQVGRHLQLILKPALAGDREQYFEIYSRSEPAQERWTLHTSVLETVECKTEEDSVEPVARLRQRLRPMPVEDYYQSLAKGGIALGPCFEGIHSLWIGTNEALGEILSAVVENWTTSDR
jgi:phthiocerol/phenolphthiocerol synthesis type-I polyketide synthase C